MLRASQLLLLLLAAGVVNILIYADAFRLFVPERVPQPAVDAETHPRFVGLGVDGVDLRWLTRYLDEDLERPMGERLLPNLQRLRERGSLCRLVSETPPESPVAWASCITGVNPGRHGIFDFVRPGANYRPYNGMVDVRRMRLVFGRVPWRAPTLRSRLSAPTFLERIHGAGYSVLGLRQPMLFPAPSLPGARLLAGLGTPDLAGGAGFYAVWSARPTFIARQTVFGGVQIPLDPTEPAHFDTHLPGPIDPSRERGGDGRLSRTSTPVRFEVLRGSEGDPEADTPAGRRPRVAIHLAGRTEVVAVGQRSPFMVVPFELGTVPKLTMRGHVRFEIHGIDPLVVLADPINIYAPTSPFPLTTPREYAAELFERYGPFETTGWTEQTFALNDDHQTDEGFLRDLLEDMDRGAGLLLGEMERGSRCVFQVITATDRGMHCFYRYYDPEHPAYREGAKEALGEPILRLFARLDRIVGDVVGRLEEDDLLLICSDHGFETWRWGVNLNQWLVNEGYMVLRDEVVKQNLATFSFEGGLGADAVDWDRTVAYAMGLGQVYLNLRGREEQGIVAPGAEADRIVHEIREKLLTLRNPLRPEHRPVREVYLLREIYTGSKVEEAAELQVGFEAAYRVSWQTALLGGIRSATPNLPAPPVFEKNTRPWSGDHCSTDPSVVPGILMLNRRVPPAFDDRPYHVRDVAATACEFFGVDVSELEGKSVLR